VRFNQQSELKAGGDAVDAHLVSPAMAAAVPQATLLCGSGNTSSFEFRVLWSLGRVATGSVASIRLL
jgi:hypothetical protein